MVQTADETRKLRCGGSVASFSLASAAETHNSKHTLFGPMVLLLVCVCVCVCVARPVL